jgi:mono/diheme cytochrome c family protein
MILRKAIGMSAVFGIALLAVLRPLPGGPVEDDEERQERLAVSKRAMQENCLICHSEEMIATARLTSKQWKAEVEKMVGWGSPLPKEQEEPLIEYLASQFPDTAPPAELRRVTLRDAEAPLHPEVATGLARAVGDPSKGAPLYASQCANCHGPDARGADLGPNIVGVPILLRPTDYAGVIRKGLRRMPAFGATLKPEQEADILAWLRQKRYPADEAK